jgi:hypothetical protein
LPAAEAARDRDVIQLAEAVLQALQRRKVAARLQASEAIGKRVRGVA